MTDTHETGGEPREEPVPPDLPAYLRDPLRRQPPARLETVAVYARELAAWKKQRGRDGANRRHDEEGLDEARLTALEARGISTDPADYDGVPASAYLTVKTTKRTAEKSYRYLYWQWREGETWKNEYVGPVDPSEASE